MFKHWILLLSLCSMACGPAETTPPGTPSKPIDLIEWEDTGCDEDPAFFQEKLWVPELSVSCIGCHQQDGLAANTRMVFVAPTSPEARQHNQAVLWNMAQINEGSTSLLLLKPTNTSAEQHTGGEMIRLGSPSYEALWYWVGRANGTLQCDGTPADNSPTPGPTEPGDGPGQTEPSANDLIPGPPVLRRLSHPEYLATLATLVPDVTDEANNLPGDNVVDGYLNNAHALTVSPLLAEQYFTIAEEIAKSIVSRSAWLSNCNPVTDNTAECATEEIKEWGKKLFRRPLRNQELSRYFEFWYTIAEEDGFFEGIKWVLTGLLQSPHFLYRSELGYHQGDGQYVLSPYEIASELSYTLLGTPPDESLLEAAENGSLSQAATILSQAQRLVQTPLAKEKFWSFIESWLGLRQLPIVVRDFTTYPEFTWEVRRDMLGQVQRVVTNSFESNATFNELLTSDRTWLTPTLENHYGIPPSSSAPDSEGFKQTTLPESYAGGLLSTGAVLTTHALPHNSSPIHRGLLVRERMLCHKLPPPPENLDTSPPEVDPTQSTRERYAEHANNAACNSCHRLIDPIGFAFEHFDGVGRWRMMDGQHEVDDSGEIVASISSDSPIEGLNNLSAHLASSAEVQSCFIQQWSTYLWGLSEESSLDSSVTELTRAFSQNQEQLHSVLEALTTLPHFTERLGDPNAAQNAIPTQEAPLSWENLLGDRTAPGASSPGTVPGLQVEEAVTDAWASGQCSRVSVTNTSSEDITWEIDITFAGELDNIWNAQVLSQDGLFARIAGAAWNAALAPGASTEFGFCVSL